MSNRSLQHTDTTVTPLANASVAPAVSAAEAGCYVYVRATWRLRDKGRLLWRTAACEGRMR